MSPDEVDYIREVVDATYRSDSRQVFATLIRLLGDFETAEEALHDAFAVAVEQWVRDGMPANPKAWLVSTGRFKAIDSMRRRARHDASLEELAKQLETGTSDPEEWDDEHVEDDRLRLICICCHPALSLEAQVAMTLREVCGLTTEEIARAFLTKPPTIAQRIVRAEAKIREARIPYEVPPEKELPDRLDAVLRVVYLVFNEGYSSSTGDLLTKHDLSGEAIRLGRLLIELLPEPEAMGLLSLMLLHDSRRTARTSTTGDLILLEDQDRSLWNRDQITEGVSLVRRALSMGQVAPTPSKLQSQGHMLRHPAQPLRIGFRSSHSTICCFRPIPRRGRSQSRSRSRHARRSVSRAECHQRDPRPGRVGELSLGPRRSCGSLQPIGANSGSQSLL